MMEIAELENPTGVDFGGSDLEAAAIGEPDRG
jgi:hypothetical protein